MFLEDQAIVKRVGLERVDADLLMLAYLRVSSMSINKVWSLQIYNSIAVLIILHSNHFQPLILKFTSLISFSTTSVYQIISRAVFKLYNVVPFLEVLKALKIQDILNMLELYEKWIFFHWRLN